MTILENRFITKPDPFESDFGCLELEKREQVVELLREFIRDMRVILDESERKTRRTVPEFLNRCETCAFASCTDSLRGFPATIYGLLLSILKDQIFTCHSKNPNWKGQHQIDREKPDLCNGYAGIRLSAGTEVAVLAIKKMTLIRKIVPTAGNG
jgi:hypothetical protein